MVFTITNISKNHLRIGRSKVYGKVIHSGKTSRKEECTSDTKPNRIL